MTRERAEDYDSKKQNILGKAAELFSINGYEVTTMVDIAKACNVSKSHIYHYFSSKEEVLFTITFEHTRDLAARLGELPPNEKDPVVRFERFVSVFIQAAAQSRNEQLVLTNDLKFLPEDKRNIVQKLETSIVDSLVTIFVEINPHLQSSKSFQRPVALLFFGMIIWTFNWYNTIGPIPPDQLARNISDLFLNGLRGMSLDGAAD